MERRKAHLFRGMESVDFSQFVAGEKIGEKVTWKERR